MRTFLREQKEEEEEEVVGGARPAATLSALRSSRQSLRSMTNNGSTLPSPPALTEEDEDEDAVAVAVAATTTAKLLTTRVGDKSNGREDVGMRWVAGSR